MLRVSGRAWVQREIQRDSERDSEGESCIFSCGLGSYWYCLCVLRECFESLQCGGCAVRERQ